METTSEERRWLAQNWSVLEGDSKFRQWLAGSDRAHGIVPRVLRDVDTVVAALRVQASRHDSACWHCDDSGCPCGGKMCNCGARDARAVLGE